MTKIKLLKDTLPVTASPFIEIEQKYYAAHVNRLDFLDLFSGVKNLTISSFDYYFKPMYTTSVSFMRYRASENPELTLKTPIKNNIIRNEVDLPLSNTSEATVREFAKMLGFDFCFSIYKNCTIVHLNDFVYSYYQIQDENFQLLDVFVEVEINKKSRQPAYILKKAKKILQKVGLSDNNICTKSIFEMYS